MYFNKFAHRGNAFTKEVAEELGFPDDRKRALRFTKAVLHALRDLRDRIPPAESVQLLAQLSLYLKAICVEGWQLTDRYRKVRRLDEFLDLVVRGGKGAVAGDFLYETELHDGVTAVLRVLCRRVTAGEVAAIRRAGLPPAMASLP